MIYHKVSKILKQEKDTQLPSKNAQYKTGFWVFMMYPPFVKNFMSAKNYFLSGEFGIFVNSKKNTLKMSQLTKEESLKARIAFLEKQLNTTTKSLQSEQDKNVILETLLKVTNEHYKADSKKNSGLKL